MFLLTALTSPLPIRSSIAATASPTLSRAVYDMARVREVGLGPKPEARRRGIMVDAIKRRRERGDTLPPLDI